MLIWKKSEKVFEKWMKICIHYKKMGDDLNIKEKEVQEKLKKEAELRNKNYEIKLTSPGNALYNFGKLLANAAFGQTLMANHDEQIKLINNVDQQYKFMDENDLDRIITILMVIMFLLVPKKWIKLKI